MQLIQRINEDRYQVVRGLGPLLPYSEAPFLEQVLQFMPAIKSKKGGPCFLVFSSEEQTLVVGLLGQLHQVKNLKSLPADISPDHATSRIRVILNDLLAPHDLVSELAPFLSDDGVPVPVVGGLVLAITGLHR